MKKRGSKILALVCSVCILMGLSTSLIADASFSKSMLSEKLMSDSGLLNEVDWSLSGDESKFKADAVDPYLVTVPYDLYLQPYQKVDLSKGDVSLEFDVLWVNKDNPTPPALFPLFGESLKTIAGVKFVSGKASHMNNTVEFYSDYECTTLIDASAILNPFEASVDAFGVFDKNIGGKIKLIFRKNGVLGFIVDGEFAGQPYKSEIYIKDALKVAKDVNYIGLVAFGEYAIDNLSIKQGQNILFETGFSGNWYSATEDVTKCYLEKGTNVTQSGYILNNLGAQDRLVLENRIEVDTNTDKALSIKGKIKTVSLTNKFGIALGLPEKNSDISAGSYIYFYNKTLDGGAGNVTYVASSGTGDEVNLGVDLTTINDFVDFNIEANSSGELTIDINKKTATFTGIKLEGFLNFACAGSAVGETKVLLGSKLEIFSYKYRGSEGKNIENNFNTSYINNINWAMQSTQSVLVTDPNERKGIIIEDENKKLSFHGAGDYSYFSSQEKYADYILEFDYIHPDVANLPSTSSRYYGALSVCIGSNSQSGYINSHMFSFFDVEDINFIRYQNYDVGGVCTAVVDASDHRYNFAGETGEKTTAVKVIVVNNQVEFFFQDITSEAFKADRYVSGGKFVIEDAYGYVCFAGSESSFFKLDNIRLTPVDNPDKSVMQKNILEYVDKKAISDEHEIITLATPILTIKDNIVSWNAVDKATGYIVTVNGVAQAKQTKNSYTIANAENGKDYNITVVAVGDGAYIQNSEISDQVVYKLQNTEKPIEKKKGCKSKSELPEAIIAIMSLAALAFVIKK